MAISNKRLHIICGLCGKDDSLSFKIDLTGGCNYDGDEYPVVFMSCDNCGSLTNLSDVIKQKYKD